jgi:hypothetical protein
MMKTFEMAALVMLALVGGAQDKPAFPARTPAPEAGLTAEQINEKIEDLQKQVELLEQKKAEAEHLAELQAQELHLFLQVLDLLVDLLGRQARLRRGSPGRESRLVLRSAYERQHHQRRHFKGFHHAPFVSYFIGQSKRIRQSVSARGCADFAFRMTVWHVPDGRGKRLLARTSRRSSLPASSRPTRMRLASPRRQPITSPGGPRSETAPDKRTARPAAPSP